VIKPAFLRVMVAIQPGSVPVDESQRILARPHQFVGQEFVTLSTAPAWQDGRLASRHLMVRLYAAAIGGGDYAVMPGGLTRAGNSPESIILSTQAGGGSKDTWCWRLAPDTTTLLPIGTAHRPVPGRLILSSRLADNLFWLGRYMERIESAADGALPVAADDRRIEQAARGRHSARRLCGPRPPARQARHAASADDLQHLLGRQSRPETAERCRRHAAWPVSPPARPA
jgi:hypothetical protein